jgi:hypothetical protein
MCGLPENFTLTRTVESSCLQTASETRLVYSSLLRSRKRDTLLGRPEPGNNLSYLQLNVFCGIAGVFQTSLGYWCLKDKLSEAVYKPQNCFHGLERYIPL